MWSHQQDVSERGGLKLQLSGTETHWEDAVDNSDSPLEPVAQVRVLPGALPGARNIFRPHKRTENERALHPITVGRGQVIHRAADAEIRPEIGNRWWPHPCMRSEPR